MERSWYSLVLHDCSPPLCNGSTLQITLFNRTITTTTTAKVGQDTVTASSVLMEPISNDGNWLPFPITNIVFFGIVSCIFLIVFLAVSLFYHHVKAHAQLLKNLERNGYKPDDEWSQSLMFRRLFFFLIHLIIIF